ncbi:MAG TPA: hypothetical protein VF591_02935 [Pyrinomonadaceae bacterium]|jgi:hypothetical protein
MRKKERATCVAVDPERLIAELQSSDETIRAKAVRSLCPCHAGWELFERHIGIVSRLGKDISPAVRAHALHVLEDAIKMHSAGDPSYRIQLAEGMVRKKRVSRFRPEEAELVEKRKGKRRGRSGVVLR